MSEVGNDNAVSPAEVFFYSVSKGDEQVQPPSSLFEREEMTQLSEDQIQKGLVRLKFKHPLTDKPIYHVLGFLRPFKCLCKKEKQQIRKMDSTMLKGKKSKFKRLQKMGQGVKDPREWRRIYQKINQGQNTNLAEQLNSFDSFIVDEKDDDNEEELMAMYEQLVHEDNHVLNLRKQKTSVVAK